MSQSRKRTPVCGNTTSRSEKLYKAFEHRAERRIVKMMLLAGIMDEDLPHPKEFGNPWGGPKDGKHWFGSKGGRRRVSKELMTRLMRK